MLMCTTHTAHTTTSNDDRERPLPGAPTRGLLVARLVGVSAAAVAAVGVVVRVAAAVAAVALVAAVRVAVALLLVASVRVAVALLLFAASAAV